LPPAILLGAVTFMVALHWLAPLAQRLSLPWRLAGIAPLAAGIALNLWTDALFNRVGTAVNPFEPTVELVSESPLRWSRNPMYLGMTLVLIGVALCLGSVSPWLVIPGFVWVIQARFILPEERKLEAAFGSRYAHYKAGVRRWL
jgi:protein-S-isoprenylcysteine O-methyltransferase Ste14